MRYRLSVLMLLMLLTVLAVKNVLAAPAPAPSAVLQIELPPKDWSMEKHLEYIIDQNLTCPHSMPFAVWLDPEIRKLPSVAARKDVKEARSWLAKNIRATKEDEGRRLRLEFRVGNRREQVAILNTLLRVYIQVRTKEQKSLEKHLHWQENCILELEQRIASGQQPGMVNSYRESINDLRSNLIPATRAKIDRFKKIAVIRWAK